MTSHRLIAALCFQSLIVAATNDSKGRDGGSLCTKMSKVRFISLLGWLGVALVLCVASGCGSNPTEVVSSAPKQLNADQLTGAVEKDNSVATLTQAEEVKQTEAIDTLTTLGATGRFKTSTDGFWGGIPGGIAGIEIDENGIVRGIDLLDTGITDSDLNHLKSFPYIQRIHLAFAGITDAGLQNLSGLVELEELDISETNITSDGTKFLKNLANLKVLRLDGTQVGDAGLESIAALNNLETLFLSSTPTTDKGLVHLKGLTKLSFLTVQFCEEVTDSGIRELKQSLPNCSIIAGDNTIREY